MKPFHSLKFPFLIAFWLIAGSLVYGQTLEPIFNSSMTPITFGPSESALGEGINNVIDGVKGNKFLTFDKSWGLNFYVDTKETSIVKSLTITTANDHPERDPKFVKIYGRVVIEGAATTDTNPSWTLIDEVSFSCNDLGEKRFQDNSKNINNAGDLAFNSYWIRLFNPCDASEANSVQIAEVQMHGIFNQAPTVTFDSNKTGAAFIGQQITAVYDYTDPEGNAESGTTYQWYVDNVAIDGSTSVTFTPTVAQIGQLLKVEITPSDGISFGNSIFAEIGIVSCENGFTCEILDISVCDSDKYQVPDGPLVSENGTYEVVLGTVKNYYNVTFDRAEVTTDLYKDAIIASSGSVTYQANTNATGILSFDKSKDYWVNMNALQDDLNGTSRSVFMWVKSEADVVSDNQVLFAINTRAGGNVALFLIDNDGENLEIFDGSDDQSASFDMGDGQWHYVGYTYNASTTETVVYVDGIENDRFSDSQATAADSKYSLGQEFDNANDTDHMNGDMAEISIWNEVLNGAEIQAAMQAKINNGHPKYANLVGYYSIFGDCNDDVAVLKDHSGKGNDGVMENNFKLDFKNVQPIHGFNAVDWFENMSWKKDGIEVSATNTITIAVEAGSYEFTATRNFIQSTDTWSMTLNSNATNVDNLSDETLCENDPITRSVVANSVNYLDFEEEDSNFIEVNSVATDLAGKNRSAFMWINKESNIGSGDNNTILALQNTDIDDESRFFIRDTEKLAVWDGVKRINSLTELVNGTWYFVGYTYNHATGETKLFVNGVEEASGTLDMPVGDGWLAALGMRNEDNGPSDFLDGKLAEITIWDKVLSQEEVTGLMAAAPAHNSTNLVAAYGTLKSIADNQLRDLTANGNNGLVSHETIIVTAEEAELTDYNAFANYSISWKKAGTEFDTDATGNITINEGTINHSVVYGTPLFQKTDEFSLSYTNLLPTQPLARTAGVTGSATFEVDEIAGASYQWYKREESEEVFTTGENNLGNPDAGAYYIAEENGLIVAASIFGSFGITKGGSVSISNNNGNTWTQVTASTNGFASTTRTRNLTIDNGIIYAGTENGLSISSDQGANWNTITNSNGLSGQHSIIQSLFVEDRIVYVLMFSGELNISKDGGNTWTSADPDFNALFVAADIINNKTYLATATDVWMSSDEGSNWTKIGEENIDGFPSTSIRSLHFGEGKLLVGADGGFTLSEDDGTTWRTTLIGENGFSTSARITSIDTHDGKIYAATLSGLSVSNDSGLTWETRTFGGNRNTILDLSVTGNGIFMSSPTNLTFVVLQSILTDNSDNTATNQIQGATTHQLTINNLSLDQSGEEYFVVITKDNCNQQSVDVALTVLDVPVVSNYTPENGSTDVAIDTQLSIEFNKAIGSKGTGELKIFNYATDALVQSFTAAELIIDGSTISITSGVSLNYATQYYITLDADLVKDASNAGNLAMTDKDTWSFHTICEALVLTQPEDQSGFIGRSVKFSVPEVAGATYQWYNNSAEFSTISTITRDTEGFLSEPPLNGSIVSNGDQIFVGGQTFSATDVVLSVSSDGGVTWTGITTEANGFPNADVTALFYKDGTLYAGVNATGLAISNDNGQNWNIISNGQIGLPNNSSIRSIYAIGNTVMVGTFSSGLWISSNSGESWSQLAGSGQNGFAASNSVLSIHVENDKVYAGTTKGLSVSEDGGSNWVTYKRGVNGFEFSGIIYDVTGQGDNIYVAADGGLAISNDAGESWRTVSAEDNGFANLTTAYSVEVFGDHFYVGSANFQDDAGGGLSISKDAGLTWNTITWSTTDWKENLVRDIYVSGATIYAAGGSGLAIIKDEAILEDTSSDSQISRLSGTDTNELTISNLTQDLHQTEYYVVVTKGDCEETSDNATLSVSCEPLVLTQPTDQNGLEGGSITFSVPEVAGASYQWFQRLDETVTDLTGTLNGSQAILEIEDVIYFGTPRGLFKSEDGGVNFTKKTTSDGLGSDDCEGLYYDNGVIYVATRGGLSISTDGGETFVNKTTADGLPDNQALGVFAQGDNVYVAGIGGLSISRDGGSSFTTSAAQGLTSNSTSVFVDGNDIYVTSFGGLFISNDDGLTFTKKTTANGLGSSVNYDLKIVEQAMFVATNGGLSISYDGGNTFVNKTTQDGLTDNWVTSLAYDNGLLYVGTNAGFLSSSDNGNTFKTISQKSTNDVIAKNGTVYFTGGQGSGVQRNYDRLETNTEGDNQIQGTTTHNLTISHLSNDLDQTEYYVVVTKGDCEETSETASLKIGGVPPIITTLSPADDEVDVSVTPEIIITFDRAIAKGTGNIEIRRTSDDQLLTELGVSSALVSVEGSRVTLRLGDAFLEVDTQYYIKIPNTAFKNTSGVAFEGFSDKTTWSFTTIGPLELISRTPSNGATDVSENAFTMVFNHPVERSYPPTARLFRATDDTEVGRLFFNAPELVFSNDKKTVSFYFSDENDLAIDLEPGTSYYVIMESFFSSPTTNEFFSFTQKTDWTFSTAATIAEPLLYKSTFPSATRDALIDFPFLNIEFNEQIAKGTGELKIYRSADNSLFEAIDISKANINNSGTPLRAQLELSQNWEVGVEYYVQYPQGLITSLDGAKRIQAIDDNTSFAFKAESFNENIITGFFPATGSNTYVADSEVDFKLYTNIGVGLERDPLGSFRIYKAANDELIKTIEYNGENERDLDYGDDEPEISFEFDDDELEPGTEYYVLIDNGFIVSYEDALYHVGISDSTRWRFTTLETPTTPKLTAIAPTSGATGVDVTSNIVLSYSENIQAYLYGETGTATNNIILYDANDNVIESFATNSDRLTYSGAKITINPTNDLSYNTSYYVLIENEAFISNNKVVTEAVTDPTIIRFTTGGQSNTAPVATNTVFTGNLEANQELIGSYTYADANSDTELGTTFQWYAADDATGANRTAISGATAQNYTLTASEIGKFVALAITPNDGTDAGTEVFTTYKGAVAAAVVPTIVSTVPVDGAVDVSINPTLTLELSEPVTLGTGSITITGANSDSYSFPANSSNNVSVSGATVTIADIGTPFPLAHGVFFTVTFNASAFVDADGNNSAGLTNQTTWNFTTIEANVAPVAQGVSIKQSIVVSEMLQGSYTFFDANQDTESGTTFQWYRADDAAGTGKTAITGATSSNYTVVNDDNGKFVSFEVTPSDGSLTGSAAQSTYFGPVLINDGITNIPPAFTSDALTNVLDNVNYSYIVTFEDLNNDVPTLTKTTGPAWLSVTGFTLSGTPGSANVGDHSVVLTLDDGKGGTVTQSFTVTVAASNTAPRALNTETIVITNLKIGGLLIGAYNFADVDRGDTDNSTYKWYRADDASGAGKTAIAGANSTSYNLTSADAGKFISFEVTPNDGKVDGTVVESAPVGPVEKKVPTLALAAIAKTYGDVNFDLSATTNSSGAITYSLNNDQTAANLTGSTVTLGNVGTITVDISLAEDTEYAARQVQGTITIGKKAIEVTATNASKNVGENDQALTFAVTKGAIVGSDEVVRVTRDLGEGVGTYSMTFTDGADAANYNISAVSGTFSINSKSITVTADAAIKTYGTSDPIFSYTVTSGALSSGDQLRGAITRVDGEGVGTYALESSLFNPDYDISFVPANLTIGKKELIATADNLSKFLGEANPQLTISYTGFVNGDTDANITPPTAATTATAASELGSYDITLSGGSAANYNLTLVNGDLTVLQRPFITTWEVQARDFNRGNRTIIKTSTDYTYNYDIDWGDGTFETGLTGDGSHKYVADGIYTIKIRGQFPQFFTEYDRLSAVEQWGDIAWKSMKNSFARLSFNINAVDAPDLSGATSMQGMFKRANIGNPDLTAWDVSHITDMSEMFMESDFNGDISNWDVSKVTNMSSMFQEAESFNGSIGLWNTASVTNMTSMFNRTTAFNQPLNSWNVSGVTNMNTMFAEANSFNQDLNSWNVSKVSNMEKMFDDAEAFNGNISGWNVSSVTDMSNMFDDAKAFNQNIGNWNVSNVIEMNSMFNDADAFNQDLNNWNVSNVETFTAMFQNADIFNGAIGNWNISNATKIERMFEDAHAFNQDISNWQPTNAENLTAMFRDARAFNQDISGWKFPNADRLQQMFYEAAVFNQDISSWETGNIVDMSSMFEAALAFNQNIGTWDVSSVTSFGSMFSGTLAFNQDLSAWDMTATTGISSMFKNAAAFNRDISGWTFAGGERGLTSMSSVFENATAFDQDLSKWDITNIRNLSNMFSNSGMSVASYDATLIGWAAQEVQNDLNLGVVGLKYCAGNAARQSLIDDHNWTIENDSQSCTAIVTIADVSGNEDDGNITVTLTLDAFAIGGFTVDVNTADGTAIAGTDYTAVTSQTITFAGTFGETHTITISPTADSDVEGDETLTLSMSNLVTGTQNTVNITDLAKVTIKNDDRPTLGFAITSTSSTESTANTTIEVALDQAGLSTVTVDYMVSGTATGGGIDYTLANGTLSFVAGDVSETINLAVINDLIIESDETVIITLSNISGGILGSNAVFTYTIVNDDFNNFPTDINLSASSIAENNALDATVGTLSTTDVDAGNVHTYTLVTGAGDINNASFTLDGSTLKTNNTSFNFEDKASYSVRIETNDREGGSFAKAFEITVTNVNEAPFALSLTNSTIEEADEVQAVGQLMSLDPDNGDTFTYRLITGEGDADNAQFAISGNTLSTAGTINFEDGDTRSIRAQVTDAGGLTFQQTFSITIEDVVAEPVRDYTQNQPGADVKNVFSPNGDGVNETWVIEDLLDNPFNQVKIFAQGGKLIYSKINYSNDWAGTFKDNPVPDGTYYYEILIYENEQSTSPARTLKGFLTIIRNR